MTLAGDLIRSLPRGSPNIRTGLIAEQFASMPVGALIDLDVPGFLGDSRASELAAGTQPTIACVNSFHL